MGPYRPGLCLVLRGLWIEHDLQARDLPEQFCRDPVLQFERGVENFSVCDIELDLAAELPGVRAANCHDLSSARNSREHNYANVLTLGAGFIGKALALDIVRTWLDTEWGAERHGRRGETITAIEQHYAKGSPEERAR